MIIHRYTADQLQDLKTVCVGQEADLKRDDGNLRYWLHRGGTEDGEPFERTVTIEERKGAFWETVLVYDGANPLLSLKP